MRNGTTTLQAIFLAVACGLNGLAGVHTAQAAVYYVSDEIGDDGLYDGLSPSPAGTTGPFQTIGRAVGSCVPGDDVRIRGGHYLESVFVRIAGSVNSVTTIAPYNSEPVLMTPDSFSAFYLGESEWVTIEGIVFTNASGITPVTIVDSEACIVSNCTFVGTTGALALYAGNATGCEVTHCLFSDNTGFAAYYLNSDGRFAHNVLERNRGSSTLTVEGAGTAGLRIVGNEFRDNYPIPMVGHTVLFVLNGGTGIEIMSNLVCTVESPAAGQAVPSGDYVAGILAAGTDAITIRDNMVSNLQYAGTVDLSFNNPEYVLTPADGGRVGTGIQVNGAGTATVAGATIHGNRVWGCGGTGINLLSVDDSVVAENEVGGNGEYGIFLGGVAGDHAHVVGNVIEANQTYGNGWQHGGMSGISLWQAGTGNIVRRNISYRNRQGTAGKKGFDWYADGMGIIADIDSDGTIIENNICFDNEGAGVAITESDDCVVVNNTLVGNGRCPHWMERPGLLIGSMDATYSARRCTAVNNLMYNNRLHQFGVYAYTSFDHSVHHNLYASGPLTTAGTASYPMQWQGAKSFSEWLAMWPAHVNGTGDIGNAPAFARDTSTPFVGSFALAATSLGLNAGAPMPSLDGELGYRIDYDAAGARRDAGQPNMGAVEDFPGGYASIESIRLDCPFPSQWVAVNVWDLSNGLWALGDHRNVYDLDSIEVRGLAGGRWYGISIWSYEDAHWCGVFVALLEGSSASVPHPKIITKTGTSGPEQGIRGVDSLVLRCAENTGAGWVAPGMWSHGQQTWIDPMVPAWEPVAFETSAGDLDDWYWAGMWHYDGGSWAPGSWVGVFSY
jgi:parallel beta-helix repeat protein